MKTVQSPATEACFCGSGKRYEACCKPLHDSGAAANAEALMRSRYSAYVLGNAAYLLSTWHPLTRPKMIDIDASTRWLGLTVREHKLTGESNAIVEFVARFRIGGASATRLHERSRFVCEGGRWYYVDGAEVQAKA